MPFGQTLSDFASGVSGFVTDLAPAVSQLAPVFFPAPPPVSVMQPVAAPIPQLPFPQVQQASLGGAIVRQLPGIAGGIAGGELLEGLFGNGQSSGTFFRVGTSERARPVREITQMNPTTGKIEVWKHAGRCLLFTGDLAAKKRVEKIAKRAGGGSRRKR